MPAGSKSADTGSSTDDSSVKNDAPGDKIVTESGRWIDPIPKSTTTKRFIFDDIMPRSQVLSANGEWGMMPTVPSSPSDGSSVIFDEYGLPLPEKENKNKKEDPPISPQPEETPQMEEAPPPTSIKTHSSDDYEGKFDSYDRNYDWGIEVDNNNANNVNVSNASSSPEKTPKTKNKWMKFFSKDKKKRRESEEKKQPVEELDKDNDRAVEERRSEVARIEEMKLAMQGLDIDDDENDAKNKQQQPQHDPSLKPTMTFDTDDSTTPSAALRNEAFRKARRRQLRQRMQETRQVSKQKRKEKKQQMKLKNYQEEGSHPSLRLSDSNHNSSSPRRRGRKKLQNPFNNEPPNDNQDDPNDGQEQRPRGSRRPAGQHKREKREPFDPPDAIEFTSPNPDEKGPPLSPPLSPSQSRKKKRGGRHQQQDGNGQLSSPPFSAPKKSNSSGKPIPKKVRRRHKPAPKAFHDNDFMTLWQRQQEEIQSLKEQLQGAHETIQQNALQIDQLKQQQPLCPQQEEPLDSPPPSRPPPPKDDNDSLNRNSIWSTDNDSVSFQHHRAMLQKQLQEESQIPIIIESPNRQTRKTLNSSPTRDNENDDGNDDDPDNNIDSAPEEWSSVEDIDEVREGIEGDRGPVPVSHSNSPLRQNHESDFYAQQQQQEDSEEDDIVDSGRAYMRKSFMQQEGEKEGDSSDSSYLAQLRLLEQMEQDADEQYEELSPAQRQPATKTSKAFVSPDPGKDSSGDEELMFSDRVLLSAGGRSPKKTISNQPEEDEARQQHQATEEEEYLHVSQHSLLDGVIDEEYHSETEADDYTNEALLALNRSVAHKDEETDHHKNTGPTTAGSPPKNTNTGMHTDADTVEPAQLQVYSGNTPPLSVSKENGSPGMFSPVSKSLHAITNDDIDSDDVAGVNLAADPMSGMLTPSHSNVQASKKESSEENGEVVDDSLMPLPRSSGRSYDDTISGDSVSMLSRNLNDSKSTCTDDDGFTFDASVEYTMPLATENGNNAVEDSPLTPRRRKSTEMFLEAKTIIAEMEKMVGSNHNTSLSSTATSPSLSISTNDTLGDDVEKVKGRNMADHYGDYGDYTGTVLKSTGEPHGNGAMLYEDYDRTYKGEWRNGRWNGVGYAYFANGDRYRGKFQNDIRNGRGVYFYRDGRIYDGNFKNDLRNGKGEFRWPNGAKYDGEWVDGKRDGRGTYRFPDDAGEYTGEWKGGLYHGFGTCTWNDHGKRQYKGEWRYGRANGQGTETDADGQIYFSGQWKDDEPLDWAG